MTRRWKGEGNERTTRRVEEDRIETRNENVQPGVRGRYIECGRTKGGILEVWATTYATGVLYI